MASLSNTDKKILENLLEMGGGYVLDFTNNTFHDFVKTAVNIDIFDDKYNRLSGSKAKRLRAFWDKEDDETVGKLLLDLMDYLETERMLNDKGISENEEKMIERIRKKARNMTGETSNKQEQVETLEDVELSRSMIEELGLNSTSEKIIIERITEIKKCAKKNIPLAALFLCGSTLEGLLLEVAKDNVEEFIKANSAPKNSNTNKVVPIEKWSLNDLINVAHQVGIIEEDVKRHTHSVRHFRNYIHPNQQSKEDFSPSKDTADIAWRVLKAAINQIVKNHK